MSDDDEPVESEPMEFKAVRSRRSPAAWIAERSRRDAQVCAGFAIVLVPCGVAATIGLFAVAFGVLEGLNLATFGVSKWLIALLALGVTFGLVRYGLASARDGRRAIAVVAPNRGPIELRLSRLTGSTWMTLFENSADTNPIVRVALNVALLAPRLFLMSRRMWRVSRRLRTLDADVIGRAADLLMSAGRAIRIADLLEEFPETDPQSLIDDLTSLDGVVVLKTADAPALTVTPSFVEEYEAWRKRSRKRPAA